MGKLTALRVKNEAAKRDEKVRTLSDGDGLNLVIPPEGSNKSPKWILRYRLAGKAAVTGLGTFPEVSLADAREKTRTIKGQITQAGKTPIQIRREQQAALAQQTAPTTFKQAAQHWFDATVGDLSKKHNAQRLSTLETFVFPSIGSKALDSITAGDIEALLRKMLNGQKPLIETATRVFQRIGAVFEYSGRHGWCKSNPASLMGREFTRMKKQASRHNPEGHHPAVLEKAEVGKVLRSIADYPSQQTRTALEVLIYTACRSGELRHATWDEIDFDHARWSIPANRMKNAQPHTIPLSRQALERLQTLKSLAGDSALVLPGLRSKKPVSDMIFSMALRRMGYSSQQTPHGFRAWFSTFARESGQFSRDAIEAGLAHVVAQGQTEAAYMRSNFLEERVRLMGWWGNWVDEMREERNESAEFKSAA